MDIFSNFKDLTWSLSNYVNKLKREDILGRVFVFFTLATLSILHFFNFKITSKNRIWIIGENAGQCLQDNGYFFYKHCNDYHSERAIYFLIKKQSPFYNELLKYPRVVRYGSIKHAYLFFLADTCLYTHTYRDLVYRTYFNLWGRSKKLAYLHHGFLAFKKFDDFYFKNKNFMDIFFTGSNFEKDILINEVGVYPEKVKVTGYARYDWLNDISDCSNQIAYIPTHRNLHNKQSIELLIEKINSLISNNYLNLTLIRKKTILKIFLHQAISEHSKNLYSRLPNIKIITFGEETCANLIKKSSLLITDYSGVSWDFFYLGKPVIFYRFDIDDYLSDRGSYIDLHKNLIGDIALNEAQVINLLKQYTLNDFKENEYYGKYRKKIMPYIDQNNCHRIYDEVCKLNKILVK